MTISPEKIADRDSIRFVKQFVDTYRSGAQGAEMDCDAAMALALSIDDILTELTIRRSQLSGLTEETSSDLVAQAVWDDIVERTTHLWAGDTVMDVLAESDTDRGAADEFARSVKYTIATTIERLTAERDEARREAKAKHAIFLIEAEKHSEWLEKYMAMKAASPASPVQSQVGWLVQTKNPKGFHSLITNLNDIPFVDRDLYDIVPVYK